MYRCGFLIIEQTAQNTQNADRPVDYYCCCWWSANRLCCGRGMRPVESSAPVVLAWVEDLWRVAFVCGPQLVGLQRT